MVTRWVFPLLYVATVVAANWAVGEFGLVPVGFGLTAPAGVYVVGVALTLRDATQEALGTAAVLGAVVLGALLSVFVAPPAVALASGTAFLVSELADFAVYTPLRRRGMIRAVVASNVVGMVADSWLFLHLAFGSAEHLPGQVVGKAWMTVIAVIALAVAHRRRPWTSTSAPT